VLQNTEQRARIEQATRQASERLAPWSINCRARPCTWTSPTTTPWARDGQRQWQLQGVIDFGDLLRTWRIADLSVTCAALLHHAEGDPLRILPAVSAYQALNPLTEAELRPWPLVLNRAAVLVLSSAQQLASTRATSTPATTSPMNGKSSTPPPPCLSR
jgi:Ser/Thr protein kinase RdoA (MazF antagonist)